MRTKSIVQSDPSGRTENDVPRFQGTTSVSRAGFVEEVRSRTKNSKRKNETWRHKRPQSVESRGSRLTPRSSLPSDGRRLGPGTTQRFYSRRWRRAELLTDGLQSVQGAFDVSDLRCQRVDGLHRAVQLLTAGHQSVHALCNTNVTKTRFSRLHSKSEWNVLGPSCGSEFSSRPSLEFEPFLFVLHKLYWHGLTGSFPAVPTAPYWPGGGAISFTCPVSHCIACRALYKIISWN